MNKKFINKWIMYHEIHSRKREGFKLAQISRDLGLDRRTVKKYLAMSEEEYLDFIEHPSCRDRVLSPYEDFVKTRLEECEDASAAQVHDWLKEHFEDFIDVNAKTVFNFVLFVRTKYGIPKSFNHRDFCKVQELPSGKQAQVDFGEYNMTTDEGDRKKIYFFSTVLSRSRYKYFYYQDHPFTTIETIFAHELAFAFFEGIPEMIVYDQDTLLLISENKGDLILTEAFRKYAEYRGFKLHFCRKSDPQSKGKVENIIRYAKYNFLRGRRYINIGLLNGQNIEWLDRTANAKEHSTTKRIPYEEWLIEKMFLSPIFDSYKPESALDERNVIKDNTITYKGNFYRVPVGTYKPPKTIVRTEVTDDKRLIIYDADNNKIASHKIYPGKGKTIGGNNYLRDFSSGIDELMNELSSQFTNPDQVMEYFLQIRKDKPRYIRDQLQQIKKLTGNYNMEAMNQAMDFCIENKIYRAADLGNVVKRILAERSQETTISQPIEIKTINQTAHKIIPNTRDISDYQSLIS
jgi:transposase